jgi:hypothetical protein
MSSSSASERVPQENGGNYDTSDWDNNMDAARRDPNRTAIKPSSDESTQRIVSPLPQIASSDAAPEHERTLENPETNLELMDQQRSAQQQGAEERENQRTYEQEQEGERDAQRRPPTYASGQSVSGAHPLIVCFVHRPVYPDARRIFFT